MDVSIIIDLLGGPTAVAKLCECEPQAVSQWKRKGIPKARLLYLKAIKPEVFEKVSHGALLPVEPEQSARALAAHKAAERITGKVNRRRAKQLPIDFNPPPVQVALDLDGGVPTDHHEDAA